MRLDQKYKTLMATYGVDTPIRIAHFMAQIEHESGLEPICENLNYSSKRLREVFPKYFPTTELANKYQRNPESIANRVYANRMGNGDEKSGDGWEYRGRGFLQITSKENYIALSEDTRLDCVNRPYLLLEESNAMLSALWFWKDKGLTKIDDIVKITQKVNGGQNGIEHRKELFEKWKNLLNVTPLKPL